MGCPPRRAEPRRPSTPDTTSDRFRPTPPRPAPKKPVMAYPAKPRCGPRRTVTTTTRHAYSDGIGDKIGSERQVAQRSHSKREVAKRLRVAQALKGTQRF